MTASIIADKIEMDGLTYDDVLLIPAYSEVLPRMVSLTTRFSRNIELHIPFETAVMGTVTEAPMAIAIAREGGIGVIHKNMSIEEQARQVAKALGLPETLIPLNTIVVGYPDTEVSPKDKWHEGSISYNQYSKAQ